MSKIKSILMVAWGVLTALFYALLKSKDRKIAKQQDQIKHQSEKIKEKEFVINEDNKTIVNRNDAFNKSDDDIKRMYEQNKWFRD